jgi:hypothetical protein
MKFAIYHREREWAREMGDPKLTEVEARSKEEAERLTAHLGMTGTLAEPFVTPCPERIPSADISWTPFLWHPLPFAVWDANSCCGAPSPQ